MNKNVSKIIIRDRIYKPSSISLRIENLKDNMNFHNINDMVSYLGEGYIMNNVYEENLNSDKLEFSSLYKSYLEVVKNNKDDKLFKIAYKISENIAIRITEHINIYRLAKDNIDYENRLVPWYYIESDIYVADSWWEEDEEIIDDFFSLSFLEFIIKYKMY